MTEIICPEILENPKFCLFCGKKINPRRKFCSKRCDIFYYASHKRERKKIMTIPEITDEDIDSLTDSDIDALTDEDISEITKELPDDEPAPEPPKAKPKQERIKPFPSPEVFQMSYGDVSILLQSKCFDCEQLAIRGLGIVKVLLNGLKSSPSNNNTSEGRIPTGVG